MPTGSEWCRAGTLFPGLVSWLKREVSLWSAPSCKSSPCSQLRWKPVEIGLCTSCSFSTRALTHQKTRLCAHVEVVVALVEGSENNLSTFLSAEFWLYFSFGFTSFLVLLQFRLITLAFCLEENHSCPCPWERPVYQQYSDLDPCQGLGPPVSVQSQRQRLCLRLSLAVSLLTFLFL